MRQHKLTILVTPINAVGHVNACLGALSAVRDRGHRVVFAIDDTFQGKMIAHGYEEFVYSSVVNPLNPEQSQNGNSDDGKKNKTDEDKRLNPGEQLAQMLIESKIIGPYSALEKTENMFESMKPDKGDKFASQIRFNFGVKAAIEHVKPDLIYFDGFPLAPSIFVSGIPWIRQFSTTPIFFIVDPELPPGGSGLPTDDRSEWHLYDKHRANFVHSKVFNDLNEQMGYERFPDEAVYPECDRQLLTVHGYPEELNYPAIRSKGWFNLEVFNIDRNRKLTDLKQLLPKPFLDSTLGGKFSGKLIYLSMGSMGSIDVELMRKLVRILGDTAHKYIVSKGPRHDEFELAPNMWGDRYVPQTKLVPHCDLVITHGGNNTVTETFIEGKPMVVLPSFADQFDNAQRLAETGFGARIDPANFEAQELLDAIDTLLNDEKLSYKLANAAARIKATDRHLQLALHIEQLFH